MKKLLQRLFLIATAILFTACGANIGTTPASNKPSVNEPKFEVIEVPLAKILPNMTIGTTYPGVYFTDSANKASRFEYYILNGLTSSGSQVWKLNNAPMATLPLPHTYMINYQNGSVRLMYSEYNHREDYGTIWQAHNLKYSNSMIDATWLVATVKDDGEGIPSTGFYPLYDYAVAGCDFGNNEKELLFVKFVSPESEPAPKKYSNGFSSSCAITENDYINAIATPLNQDQIKSSNYIGVGTSQGGLCIYGAPGSSKPEWQSLTEVAKKIGGYSATQPIHSVQFINFDNKQYIYWILEDGKIWRGIIDDANINQSSFVNLQGPNYKNAPSDLLLNHQSLFVDLNNNVYVGSNGNFDKKIPAKLYVLLDGASIWQEIVLKDDFNNIKHIHLATDGVTPIVGTSLDFANDRTYYILKSAR